MEDLEQNVMGPRANPPQSYFRPSKPATFEGKRDALLIENWLAQMEDYAELTGIPSELRTRFAGTYLRGQAAYWFMLARRNWEEHHPSIPLPWEEFASGVRKEFIPPNHQENLLDRWAKYKQVGSVFQYTKGFTELRLQLPPGYTTELQILDKYIRGLKLRTQQEVRMRSPSTLAEAMHIADRFDSVYSNNVQSVYTPRMPDFAPMDLGFTQTRKLSNEERQKLMKERVCFRCRKPGHISKQCNSGKGQGQ